MYIQLLVHCYNRRGVAMETADSSSQQTGAPTNIQCYRHSDGPGRPRYVGWLLEASTYSRPEDGLSCRHSVKPLA